MSIAHALSPRTPSRSADEGSPRPPRRSTHDVANQPPPLSGYDTFASDAALVAGAQREGAGWARDRLHALGRVGGSEEAIAWGFEANESPPVLRTHDRYGHRVDEVAYHPSYHRLMEVAIAHGLHSLPWREPREGAHVARAAMFIAWRVDAGHGCPVSMTYVEASGLPRLFRESPLNGIWEGSSNVICLDVLRALARDPGALELFLDEVEIAAGADASLDAAVAALRADLAASEGLEARARSIVERMALVLQGSLLVRHTPSALADAYCASRLGGHPGRAFGTLPPSADVEAIVDRARPRV